jgi:hypothetical protein
MRSSLLLIVAAVVSVGQAAAGEDGGRGSSLRDESKYLAHYLAISEQARQAGRLADEKFPPKDPPQGRPELARYAKEEAARAQRWLDACEAEQARRFRAYGERHGMTLDELYDLKLEGDVRRWGLAPDERAKHPVPDEEARRLLSELRRLAGARNARPDRATSPARVSVLMKAARNLEAQGKFAGAVEFYKKLIKEFPDAPEAKAAAARVQELGRR